MVAEWPTPVFYCGPEVGQTLRFPAAAIDKDFAWAPAHPIADAYRAFQPMPYDAPAYDVAAAHYAVHPDSGFFQLSEMGALSVSESGVLAFSIGGGKVQRLIVDVDKKPQAIAAFVETASAKPIEPQQRFRRADAKAQDAAGTTKGTSAKDPKSDSVTKKQDR